MTVNPSSARHGSPGERGAAARCRVSLSKSKYHPSELQIHISKLQIEFYGLRVEQNYQMTIGDDIDGDGDSAQATFHTTRRDQIPQTDSSVGVLTV